MHRAKSFRDLAVWQRSIELTTEIYGVTAGFPSQERYGLTSQMCRAAVSVPSNIAEGHARSTARDFRHFVLIAKGSSNELQTQLVIAQRLRFGAMDRLRRAEAECMEISLMLHGLARFLQTQISPAHSQLPQTNFKLPTRNF